MEAALDAYFERCEIEADKTNWHRAEADWDNLRTMGYTAKQLVEIAKGLRRGSDYISFKTAVLSTHRLEREPVKRYLTNTKEFGHKMGGLTAFTVAEGAIFGITAGTNIARFFVLSDMVRQDEVDEVWEPFVQRTATRHMILGLVGAVRVAPIMISVMYLDSATSPRELDKASAGPYLLLGGLDVAIGVLGLGGAHEIGLRPLDTETDVGSALQESATALQVFGILGAALGTTEIIIGVASADSVRQHTVDGGQASLLRVRLSLSPSFVGIHGRF